MPSSHHRSITTERQRRETRLGFRVDKETKNLVEKAAALERRTVTDFCLTALIQISRETIRRNEGLDLSERDRAAFFEALVNPPKPNQRLRRAFAKSGKRIKPR